MYMLIDGDRLWKSIHEDVAEAKAAFEKMDEYDQKYGCILELVPSAKEPIIRYDHVGEGKFASWHYGELKKFL